MTYTTAKDFELFKRECNRWIDKLSLHDWEFRFYYKDAEADSDETSHFVPKIIIIRFSKSIEAYPTKIQAIKKLASEEVLHALLENLSTMAFSRGFIPDMYLAEEHNVIHRLQKAFDK